MIIEHQFYPPHLGKEFLEVYSQIKEERIEAKHSGNKNKDATLKLALNGLSGNLQNEHNFCYSPKTVMQIRMNGQLMLLILAERLVEIGCRIIQTNTDGIFVVRKKSRENEFKRVCSEWEELTKLTLEEDRFEAMYQFAINDYLAIKEGYKISKDPKLLKKKGLFIDEVKLGKGMPPIIIPKAINNYFANAIPVIDTLKQSDDIQDFITYQKVKKEFSVEYAGELISHINRYYMSTDGHKIRRCTVDSQTGVRSNYSDLCATSGVTIINKFDDLSVSNKHINYGWYCQEIYKIIYALEDSLNPTLF